VRRFAMLIGRKLRRMKELQPIKDPVYTELVGGHPRVKALISEKIKTMLFRRGTWMEQDKASSDKKIYISTE
jgi:hypothetical protein